MVVVMKNDDCDIVTSVRCFERQNNVSVGNAERANGGGAGYYERQNHVLVRNEEKSDCHIRRVCHSELWGVPFRTLACVLCFFFRTTDITSLTQICCSHT